MYRNACALIKEDEREKTIEEFIPMIKHLAYKACKGLEEVTVIEDLISAGIVGLLEAMEKYDANRGVKLNSFAYMRIRGAIIDELRSKDWFPRSARTKAKRMGEAVRKLENKLGRGPNEEEIAEELNIDLEDYLAMLRDYGNLSIVSIEDLSETSGEDTDRIIRYMADESDDPEQYAELSEMKRILAEELDRIPERQKLVLTLYYQEEMNMKEIAKALGITEARVCQIHSQALPNRKRQSRHKEVEFAGKAFPRSLDQEIASKICERLVS